MTLQEATEACLDQLNLFARPVSWKKTGEAIDLARRLDSTRMLLVRSMGRPTNVVGSLWNPAPQDFLSDWETVTAEELTQEA